MPSLIDIRRRIRAVKSTQQITKAMKMVASSKLRRAQERVLNARPYAAEMSRLLHRLTSSVDPTTHPLLTTRTDLPVECPMLLIVITADKGLCGSFNTNAIKAAGAFIENVRLEGGHVALGLVGRRGRDFFVRQVSDVRFDRINLFSGFSYADAQEITGLAIDAFKSGVVRKVSLVYNEFTSIMQQRVVTVPILPIPRTINDDTIPSVDYLFEPPHDTILPSLISRYLEVQVYRALLESAAAEQAARMMAMDSATRNSAEMIENLTLYMNKVRQAAITREIIEVVSGAEAL